MRRDLADIRLAEYVFAPHYAAPIAMVALEYAVVTLTADADSDEACVLETGDIFEALDFSGNHAWGIATKAGRVGYVLRSALAVAPEPDAATA